MNKSAEVVSSSGQRIHITVERPAFYHVLSVQHKGWFGKGGCE